jgi:hypothetical protein
LEQNVCAFSCRQITTTQLESPYLHGTDTTQTILKTIRKEKKSYIGCAMSSNSITVKATVSKGRILAHERATTTISGYKDHQYSIKSNHDTHIEVIK